MFHGDSNVTLRNNCPERSWRSACTDNKRVNWIQHVLPQQRQQRHEITSETTQNIVHVIMLYTFINSYENLRHFQIWEEILILNVYKLI